MTLADGPSRERFRPRLGRLGVLLACLFLAASGISMACGASDSEQAPVRHELAVAAQEADEFYAEHPGPFEQRPCSYDPEIAQADCGGRIRYLLRPTIQDQASCALLSDDAGPLALTCETSEGTRVFKLISRTSG